MSDTERQSERGYGWICTGCKKVISSQPFGPCHDCGGHYRPAIDDDLACDRCEDEDASRVFNSDHNRLCDDCIDYENRENPECPDCGRRMLPDDLQKWDCPDCWQSPQTENNP